MNIYDNINIANDSVIFGNMWVCFSLINRIYPTSEQFQKNKLLYSFSAIFGDVLYPIEIMKYGKRRRKLRLRFAKLGLSEICR